MMTVWTSLMPDMWHLAGARCGRISRRHVALRPHGRLHHTVVVWTRENHTVAVWTSLTPTRDTSSARWQCRRRLHRTMAVRTRLLRMVVVRNSHISVSQLVQVIIFANTAERELFTLIRPKQCHYSQKIRDCCYLADELTGKFSSRLSWFPLDLEPNQHRLNKRNLRIYHSKIRGLKDMLPQKVESDV